MPETQSSLSPVERLRSLAGIGALDLTLAAWLARHDPEREELLAFTGALLSRERSAGHSGISLAAWAERPLAEENPGLTVPELAEWTSALEASPLVGAPGDIKPLILEGSRLYLYRYWKAEQRVADHLARRVAKSLRSDPPAGVRDAFRALFPVATESPEVDHQAVAAVVALRRRLCLIAGGPGTGKTTTVARILALLLTRDPELRIALAAPTGKAANQLGSSIAAQRDALNIPNAVRRRIPAEPSTLHRLLGYRPSAGFTYGPDHPLPVDVLVIDESSMVDLLLFEAVLDALPEAAQLILLGDPHQLASVETGFVFGDLCMAGDAEGVGADTAAYAAELGLAVPAGMEPLEPLSQAVVRLRKSYRFGAESGIAAFAEAIRVGDAVGGARVLRSPGSRDLSWLNESHPVPAILDLLGPFAASVCDAGNPEAALERLSSMRLLSPTHWGPRGIRRVNERVETWLLQQGSRTAHPYYQGRPLLITSNDYSTHLFNGDVGVCWGHDGRDLAWFPDGEGGVRSVPVSQLPKHQTVYAMTVHKSQGSEFEHVILLLPEALSAGFTRELLYTAVTRAREHVTVFGCWNVIEHAIVHPERRESGLVDRIRQATR